MISRLIILLLLLPAIGTAQIVYKGHIINQKTKENIPYATIGLIKENTGINANEQGYFQINSINPKEGDTLIASCIGYETVKIPVVAGTAEYTFELPEKAFALQPVEVSNKPAWTTATLNDFTIKEDILFFTQAYVLQVATHFTAPVEFPVLQSVRIYTRGAKCKFRLRMYELDPTTKKPAGDLCSSVIEVETGRRDNIIIDLSKYDIVIPGKEFFVAIEWLKIPGNFVHEKRNSAFNDFYNPVVNIVSKNSKESNWMKDYTNNWIPYKSFELAISATIKY